MSDVKVEAEREEALTNQARALVQKILGVDPAPNSTAMDEALAALRVAYEAGYAEGFEEGELSGANGATWAR